MTHALQVVATVLEALGLDPRLAHVRIDAAVNWHNMLLGPKGVARVFGPQKGGTPDQVELLDRAMETWAKQIWIATTPHTDPTDSISRNPG